jgi:rRNA maturation RNase YbeY
MADPINFFAEKVIFTLTGKNLTREWIRNTANNEHAIAGDINIIFCDDQYLRKLNRRYLFRNTLTDVISFSLNEDESVISGDIFISIPRVKENAKIFGQTFRTELNRVMIHGVLHLLGYKDDTPAEKSAMQRKENFYLKKLEVLAS